MQHSEPQRCENRNETEKSKTAQSVLSEHISEKTENDEKAGLKEVQDIFN
jgi:hypothetical protein